MDIQAGQKAGEKKKKSYAKWSREEETRILEFILMNPHDIIDGPSQRRRVFPELYKYVQTEKTQMIFKKKIQNLLLESRKFGQLVDALKRSTKVDDEWIKERTKTLSSRGLNYLELRNNDIKIKVSQPEEKQTWTEEQHTKLLEFVLLYPQKIYHLHLGNEIARLLHHHINSTKTELHCYYKFQRLLSSTKQYEAIVNYLVEKTNVDKGWIEDRKNIKYYVNAQDFQQKIINHLKEDSLIVQRALKLLVSNFDCFQALFYRQNPGPNEVFLKLSPVVKDSALSQSIPKNHFDNQMRTQPIHMMRDSDSEIVSSLENIKTQERIATLRYCLFLTKYQTQIEHESLNYMTEPIFLKIASFTEAKSQYHWRSHTARYISKERNNIEMIVSDHLENLYVKHEELESQIKSVENFYQEDLRKEMNAFVRKSKLQLTSSNQVIYAIIQRIKQEVSKLLQQQIEFQQISQSHKQKNGKRFLAENFVNRFKKQRIVVKLSLKFDVTLQKVLDVQGPDKTTKESSMNYQAAKSSVVSRQSLPDSESKKDKLKVKKQSKEQSNQEYAIESSRSFRKSHNKEKKEKCLNYYEDLQHSLFSPEEQERYKSFDMQNEQNDVNVSKHDRGRKTVKKIKTQVSKQKTKGEIRNLNYFEQGMDEQPRAVQPQKTNKPQTLKRIWSLSERMKITLFLCANEEVFHKGVYNKESNVVKELADYVGTQKSQGQFTNYVKVIKNKYLNDMGNAIKEEGKKYQISKELIDQCKRLGNSYKEMSEVTIGENVLILSSYPIIMADSCLESFEAQIEDMIRKGPFVEAKLKFGSEILNKSQESPNEPISDENTRVIQIQETLEYKAHINVPQSIWTEQMQLLGQKQGQIKMTMKSAVLIV